MSPCVLRLVQPDGKWHSLTVRPGGEAPDIVKLLTEAPEFLGLLEPDQPMPRAVALVPNSASGRVLVAVDEKGGLRLVACPDAKDTSQMSVVMGDLLSTGGRFWHQPYATLAGVFEQSGGSLADRVSRRARPGWSADSFKASVEERLNQGRFPITIVVRELTKPIQDTLGYLANMNLGVRVLGYSFASSGTVETATPVALGERTARAEPAPEPKPAPQARPAPQPKPEPRPAPQPAPEPKPVTEARPTTPDGYRIPFGAEQATDVQVEILEKLLQLDELKLIRRGMEYLLSRPGQKEQTEGTIVVSIDPGRWPFPGPEEVVVVVRTGQEHLAGWLNITQQEIEEFLASLPRMENKETPGALLLKATNTHEASQMVNELKALKEVAQSGVS